MILNLTQHPATAEQMAVGVVDLQGESLQVLKTLLTFKASEGIPTKILVVLRAREIARIARDFAGCESAMIGGVACLMGPLTHALTVEGVNTVFSFSDRVSVETTQPDGSVVKTSEFRHLGFV